MRPPSTHPTDGRAHADAPGLRIPGAATRWQAHSGTRLADAAARFSPHTAATLAAIGFGLFLALAAGAIARSRTFDGLYGQDAYAYFDYGAASVQGSLQHLSPLEPFFWPPGYPLLVALMSFVVGPVPLAGQLVSLLLGALVPVLTVLLVHELWPDDLPLALQSGAMVAVCGQLWQSSVVVMSDTTGLALATLSAVALVRYARRHQAFWLLIASAAIAYATLARWIYGLVAVPFAIYALIVLLESIRQQSPTSSGSHSASDKPAVSTAPGADLSQTGVNDASPTDEQAAKSGYERAVPAADNGADRPAHAAPESASARPDLSQKSRFTQGASESSTTTDGGAETASRATDDALVDDGAPVDPTSGRRTSSSDVARRSAAATRLSPRVALLHAVAALLLTALILVPAVAQPLIGLMRDPGQPATFAGNFQVYSWSPLNALRHDFFTVDGHLAYTQPNGVYYAVAPANFAYFGPLLAVWILPGAWAARRWPVRNIVLIVGWAAVVFAFHAGAPWQNFRFALAYLPPAAILAAAGLLLAWRWFDTPVAAQTRSPTPDAPAPADAHSPTTHVRAPDTHTPYPLRHPSEPRRHTRAMLRTAVAACIALGLLTTTLAAARLVERFIDTKDQELALVHWVQSQTPADAQLLTFGPTLAFRRYSSLPTYDLFDVTAPEVRAIVAEPGEHYLLVDLVNVESQWLNQSPSTNYHLLRDEVGLRELGTLGGYTLYQIARPT